MTGLTYLPLEDLEAIAFQFPGHEILAAQGPSGDEWHLKVPMEGKEVTFRAHRPVVTQEAS